MHIKNEFPIYDVLQRGDVMGFRMSKGLKNFLKLTDTPMTMPYVISTFGAFQNTKERYYITTPFVDAYYKASKKMDSLSLDSVNKALEKNALVIYRDWFVMHEKSGNQISFYIFGKNGLSGLGGFEVNVDPDTNELTFRGNGYLKANDVQTDERTMCFQLFTTYLYMLVFKNECEIETKIIEPNKKYRHEGRKIYNDTNNEIVILNCNWFIELVRSTPFSVNGHFRWQPCGENRSKKKLIWIESFEKHGYTRKAKKEIQ